MLTCLALHPPECHNRHAFGPEYPSPQQLRQPTSPAGAVAVSGPAALPGAWRVQGQGRRHRYRQPPHAGLVPYLRHALMVAAGAPLRAVLVLTSTPLFPCVACAGVRLWSLCVLNNCTSSDPCLDDDTQQPTAQQQQEASHRQRRLPPPNLGALPP